MKKKLKEHGNIKASFDFFLEQKINKDVQVLDIGCYMGSLPNALFNEGYKNIVGVDINKTALKNGQQQYSKIKDRLKHYDGLTLPFDDSVFDVVTSFDVIEHIPDVDYHFKEVKRVLKKDGLYLFQTPNKITNIPWEIINQRHPTKWRSYHISLHTYGKLQRRVKNNGFEIIKFEKRDLLNEYNIQKVQKKIGKSGVKIVQLVNKMPIYLTTNFWCVCKKL